MQISKSAFLERLRTGYRTFDEIHCRTCDVYVDLSDAETLDEAREIWNDHVDESGGNRYV